MKKKVAKKKPAPKKRKKPTAQEIAAAFGVIDDATKYSEDEILTAVKVVTEEVEGSTDVAEIGYIAATGTLGVKFLKGSIYLYHGVAPKLYTALKKTKSKGKFLYDHREELKDYTKVQ